jgi:ABC-2 type transport system ATP-binding protein
VLQIEKLNKSYGARSVLQDLTLHIQAGEIYGLLGPNGAGKTTTINILCNLLNADSGQVSINGEPVSEATKLLIGVAPKKIYFTKALAAKKTSIFLLKFTA